MTGRLVDLPVIPDTALDADPMDLGVLESGTVIQLPDAGSVEWSE